MASIKKQKVRATITIEGIGSISTPDVVSFNVRRARKQTAASFTASIRVSYAALQDLTSSDIVIKAGVEGSEQTIFTGRIEKATINPIRTDVSKVMLSLSGRDKLSVLEGQNIDRRLKTWKDGEGPPERFAIVSAITKHNTAKMQKFSDKVTSFRPKAVKELPVVPLETTPDAFRLKGEVDRSVNNKTAGALQITKLTTIPEE